MEEKNQSSSTENIEVENVTEGQEDKGLSLRESLSVAVTAAQDKEDTATESRAPRGTRENPIIEKIEEPERLEAPATWNEQEKADFYASTRKQQEAALRLDRSRNSRLEELKNAGLEAKRASQEYEHVKKIAESISPLIKAHGVKDSPEEVMRKAALLWHEFEYAKDPMQAAANYLKAKGVEPPSGWDRQEGGEDEVSKKISSLQERQDQLLAKLAEKEKQEQETKERYYADYVSRAFTSFAETKNANGTYKYPDLYNPELGPKVAAKVGSLVHGRTELSKQFLQEVRDRIHEASDNQILEEALRFVGSKIDDSPAKTQSAINHVQKAKRASSSVPGGSTLLDQGRSSKKLSLRDSLRFAIEQGFSD